jgi:hypothetical protein
MNEVPGFVIRGILQLITEALEAKKQKQEGEGV